MESVLDSILPTFTIVLIGWLMAKLRLFRQIGVDGVAQYVFGVAVPLLLFRLTARATIPAEIPWGFLLSYYLGAVLTFVIGMLAAGGIFHNGLSQQGAFGGAASYSNTVLLGIPVVLGVLGDAATVPLFILIGVHGMVMVPLVVTVISIGRRQGGTAGKVARETLGELIHNPFIVALVAGALYGLYAPSLPGPIDDVIATLAGTAGPCALFALGGVLAQYPVTGGLREAAVVSLVKLVLHPAIVWALATQVFSVDPSWVWVAVLLAAMPSGINVFVLAHRYEVASGGIGMSVVLSTALALATLAGVIQLIP
ncbi:MAG: AEC family transporter [Rhodospirillales bacterium]|nr:MAG: AEC family transporter [Rhodospirillales bacterium]